MKTRFFVLLLLVSIGCNNDRSDEDKAEKVKRVMEVAITPDNQAVAIVARKNDVEVAKTNSIIKSYLSHFDLIAMYAHNRKLGLKMEFNPDGQEVVIDSLSTAFSIPPSKCATLVYDYLLFVKKCDADDNAQYDIEYPGN